MDRRTIVATVAVAVVLVGGVVAVVRNGDSSPLTATHAPATGSVRPLVPCPDRELQVPGDPYSPACGLAEQSTPSAQAGVTDNEITVSYAVPEGADHDELRRTVEGLADYFNQHFQFHGRRINMVARDANTPVFADITADVPHASELGLADLGVIAIGNLEFTATDFTQHRPYLWSVTSDCSQRLDAAVALAINRHLSGPLAIMASAEVIDRGCAAAAQTRASNAGFNVTLDPINNNEQASAAIQRAQSAQATTVVLAATAQSANILREATSAAFHPQWISADRELGLERFVRSFDADTWGAALGITDRNISRSTTASFGYAAYKMSRDDEPSLLVDVLYQRLDLLSIGLQLAGRQLSPTAFEAALKSYPAHIGPYGTWDTTHSYAATSDFAVLVWDAHGNQPGGWTSDGRRFAPDELANS